MLLNTNMPVNQIAAALKFSDAYWFSNFLKAKPPFLHLNSEIRAENKLFFINVHVYIYVSVLRRCKSRVIFEVFHKGVFVGE